VDGKAQIIVDGRDRTVRKGELFAVKSNAPHSYRTSSVGVRMIIASSPVLRDYVFGEE
jgi:quercetin dioxygenase-like cupin family protein